jgi:hypothetical protein
MLKLVQQVIGINQQWLDEWIAYRTEDKKKPMTPRAIKMTIKWLLSYPEDEQERLISHAIMNSWEGLHYVEPPKKQSSRQSDIYSELTDKSWAN